MSDVHLTGTEAVAAIKSGEISAENYAHSCLQRREEFEQTVQAWSYLDPELVLLQAREADRVHQTGRPTGPLHGVPVAVSDLIDTKDMPTEAGTAVHAGRKPVTDSTVAGLLRQAGAIVAGKTVTAEVGAGTPGKTRNPHDGDRSAGGGGDAAVVAAHMAPLSIGTQSDGEIIEAASYCGVTGYVPTAGHISRYRVLKMSPSLDRVGLFGRGISDVALLAETLMSYDDRDDIMAPRGRPNLSAVATSQPPATLHFACVKTSAWSAALPETRDAFDELTSHLGDQAETLDLSQSLAEAEGWFRTVYLAELAQSLAQAYDSSRDKLSDTLCALIEDGRAIPAVDYLNAATKMAATQTLIGDILADYDVIVTPACLGEAPMQAPAKGQAGFATLWSYCGLPAVSLPILQGAGGLPVGIQMVAGRQDDARLLRNANWLLNSLRE